MSGGYLALSARDQHSLLTHRPPSLHRFHFEHILEQYDEIMFNPFSRKAKWRRAIIRKLHSLEREIGVLNYQFHGDESFPNPVDFMQVIHDDNQF